MPAVAVVPAAGRGERFGGAKLLADVDGEPLLNRTLRGLLDGGVAAVVVVTAPGAAFDRVPLTADPRVTAVVNADPARGMFSSIQTGVAAATGEPILILPGDMPFVRSDTVAAVIAECARTGQVVQPTFKNRHGHPIGMPAGMRAAVLAADARTTLNDVLSREPARRRELPVDDPGVLRDIDVAGDLIGY